MGGTRSKKARPVDPAVRRFIGAVSDERRALYDRLEAVILSMYPEAKVGMAYGVPTYGTKPDRVGLAYWKDGVSFYPYSGSALDEFRARYPAIRTGKGTINFRVSDKVPVAALKKLIKHAMERSRDD